MVKSLIVELTIQLLNAFNAKISINPTLIIHHVLMDLFLTVDLIQLVHVISVTEVILLKQLNVKVIFLTVENLRMKLNVLNVKILLCQMLFGKPVYREELIIVKSILQNGNALSVLWD